MFLRAAVPKLFGTRNQFPRQRCGEGSGFGLTPARWGPHPARVSRPAAAGGPEAGLSRAASAGQRLETQAARPSSTAPQPPAEFPQAPFHSVHTPPPGEDHRPECLPSAVTSVSESHVNGVEQRALLRVRLLLPAGRAPSAATRRPVPSPVGHLDVLPRRLR